MRYEFFGFLFLIALLMALFGLTPTECVQRYLFYRQRARSKRLLRRQEREAERERKRAEKEAARLREEEEAAIPIYDSSRDDIQASMDILEQIDDL